MSEIILSKKEFKQLIETHEESYSDYTACMIPLRESEKRTRCFEINGKTYIEGEE